MTKYFLNRMIRRKLWWISIGGGCTISVLYFIFDVWMPGGLFDDTVYTKWIECFSASEMQTLFFMAIPFLAAMAMADIYFVDKESGYLNVLFSKVDAKRYFRNLYCLNFCAGGLCLLMPLLVNLYLCFLVCPNRAPDLIVEGTNVVNYLGDDTLFPQLYYEHPFAHVCIYLLLGFIASGIFASIALALSFFVKNRFLVWISSFLINYVFISLSVAMTGNSQFALLSVCIMHGGAVTLQTVTIAIVSWIVVSLILYLIGVKRSEKC